MLDGPQSGGKVKGELVTIRMNKRIEHVDHGSVVQMKLAILVLIKQTSNIVRMLRRRTERGRQERRRGHKVRWKKERLVISSLIKGFAINLENLRNVDAFNILPLLGCGKLMGSLGSRVIAFEQRFLAYSGNCMR